ncbi:lipoyl synthase [bacterium]|nr:lipoyl synthase [bacterium]
MEASSRRFPPWLKKRIPSETHVRGVRELLSRLELHTVCQSAHCPNGYECFARGTATFMILGDACTRNCAFCAVRHGSPEPVDADEARRVAEAVQTLGLRHVVVTSVTRDDLPDGGSQQFADTIAAIRDACDATIEVLTPDFQGSYDAVHTVIDAHPDVFNHNVETAPRLYPVVRPDASYPQSLDVLLHAKERDPSVLTKSGIMVGLGETEVEVHQVFTDLRAARCDALTIGQYLSPSPKHHPVVEFVTPEQFDSYKSDAEAAGFRSVASAPFVRSSYEADQMVASLSREDR